MIGRLLIYVNVDFGMNRTKDAFQSATCQLTYNDRSHTCEVDEVEEKTTHKDNAHIRLFRRAAVSSYSSHTYTDSL